MAASTRPLNSSAYSFGIEALDGEMIDELLRQLEFGFRHLGRLDAEVLQVANFRFEMQLMHGETVRDRSYHYDVFFAARDPTPDRTLSGFTQRGRKQRVGLRAALVGRQIIGAVKINRVDRLQRDELADIDCMGRRVLERLQLLGTEHDILVLGEFVALDHFRALDELAVGDRNILLFDARTILLPRRLKDTRSDATVAEYSLTGMATSPKEMVREAIERACAAMIYLLAVIVRGQTRHPLKI